MANMDQASAPKGEQSRRTRAKLPAALIMLIVATSCDRPKPPETDAKPLVAKVAPASNPCARQADYEQLKTLAFRQAAEVHAGDDAPLTRLASGSSVRMENAAVTSRDPALNVALCSGRMVIDLPPGAVDSFSGERKLVAEIAYAVQAATDGTRRVYRLQGADPIIYRLAAIGLGRTPLLEPDQASTPQVAVAAPTPAPPQVRPAPTPETRIPARARPSFDCRTARTAPDRLVCSDERLAALDREATAFYREALDNVDGETRAILRETAADFAARRSNCRNRACVAAAYQDRVDEIERIAVVD